MSVILSFSLLYVIYRIFTCKEGKLFALKEYIALGFLKYQKRQIKSRLDNYDIFHPSDLKKVNVLVPDEETKLEHRNVDDYSLKESVFAFGSNSKGERLVTRIIIQGSKASVWIILKTEDGKVYKIPKDKLWNVPKTDASCFAAGGLRLRCLVPFRKWRISYNGLLREQTEVEGKDVHVKFNFIWTASSSPFDYQDFPNDVMARYLAGITWGAWFPDTTLLPNMKDALEQAGNMTGNVTINGGEEKEVLLWGGRIRSSESSFEVNHETTKDYFAYMSEGDYVHISEICEKNSKIPKRFVYGFIVHCSSISGVVERIEIKPNETEDIETRINFTRGTHDFVFDIEKAKEEIEVQRNRLEIDRKYSFSKAKLNDDHGFSMTINSSSSVQKEASFGLENFKPYVPLPKKTDLVLNIDDVRCKSVDFTGGKGSSLAELSDISKNNKNVQFLVPKGFVVTTASYEKFIEFNQVEAILKETALEEIAWGIKEGDLKSACESTVAKVAKLTLPENVRVRVQELLSTYGDTRFAVRSSASGEDSEEMSAAGQMETFLGVKGVNEVTEAIVKCWASQFSHTAIQYKKQNGQVLNSMMAVVVQEMVPAQKAGVMFTCNPLTGNPENITITANYGLGESVVSASADPDTVFVKRNTDGNLTIESIQIGKKTKKTMMTENGGVSEEDVSNQETEKCCLSNEDALKLAKLGYEIEEEYGCPLDIEWAIIDGQVFLLQARPVTTFDRETDFELIHETDSLIRCERECMTKANVGEVMPGAMTELGAVFMSRLMDVSMQKHWLRKDQTTFPVNPYFQRSIMLTSKHMVFNTIDTLLKSHKSKERNGFTKATEIGIFGRILEDQEILDRAVRRNQFYPIGNQKTALFRLLMSLMKLGKNIKTSSKFVSEYKMNMDHNLPADEFYHQLLCKMFEIASYTSVHTDATISSSMYSLVLLSILAKANNDEWNEVVFSDFALLMSSCKEVESADVPFALQELAKNIKESIDPDVFYKMSVDEAIEWLQNSNTPARTHFQVFLRKHGHRCVKEFDIETSPWRENPRPLVKSLQEMVKTAKNRERSSSVIRDTIKSLKVPLNWKTRLLLNLAVPFCKTAVIRREMSKSIMIKTMDYFRQEFNVLADKMVQEGRLPDGKLLFFLTIHEIDELLKTRSPKLIQKAIRRRTSHPTVNSYRFPEITMGLPKPINLQKPENYDNVKADIVLKGTPVSQGVVKARVRVANDLEEAANIQPGEILIAYSTDIGWSPYFPVLAGVVTELGGLVSHGAVVAREYGLPCVVALHGATSIFRTGEMAILDGNKGTLQRVVE